MGGGPAGAAHGEIRDARHGGGGGCRNTSGAVGDVDVAVVDEEENAVVVDDDDEDIRSNRRDQRPELYRHVAILENKAGDAHGLMKPELTMPGIVPACRQCRLLSTAKSLALVITAAATRLAKP